MLTAVSFIVVLGILIFVHELGHFVTAKAVGVKVLEFGFGFPPRLFGIRKGETMYSINILPLGGFVKMVGEEDPSHPRSLAGKPARIRLMVLAAGSFMNIMLPLIIFSALFIIPQQTIVGQVRVNDVAPDSPADNAGVIAGDIITNANGHKVENIPNLAYRIQLSLGDTMSWDLIRAGEIITVRLAPRFKTPEGQGATGITIETTNPRRVTKSLPFWEAIPQGAVRIGEVLIIAKNEVSGWVIGGSNPQLAGPVGIAQVTGEVARAGIIPLAELTALLSINLAVLNILPLPMLDGGRVMFVVLEILRRGKRIPPRKEGLVHLAGFVLLISLVIIISYFDILRILRGESMLR